MRALLAASLLIVWPGAGALAQDAPAVPVAPNKGLAEVLAKARASKRLKALEGGAHYRRTTKRGKETLIWVRTVVRPTEGGELHVLQDTFGEDGDHLKEALTIGLDGRFRGFSAASESVQLRIEPNGEWLRVHVGGSRTQARKWKPEGIHLALACYVLPRLRDLLPKSGLKFLPCEGFAFKAEATLKAGRPGEVILSGGEGALSVLLSAKGEILRIDAPREYGIGRVTSKVGQAWIKGAEATKAFKAKSSSAVFQADKARRLRARAEIRSIISACKLYKIHRGRWPGSLKDLVESTGPRWRGPYLDGGLPKDPWGNTFDYALAGRRPVVTSYGADGKLGGTGEARDVERE